MGYVIVISFISLDGVVIDPDGSGGMPAGGWVFWYGFEMVGGDKFRLGELMDIGVLLFGWIIWELFSWIWLNRIDEFLIWMNKMVKVVASHSLTDIFVFFNLMLMEGLLIEYV